MASSSSCATRFNSCFREWIAQQESDLDELLLALPTTTIAATDDRLRSLVAKILCHYEDYSARRHGLICEDPPAFCCPGWCSSFENSFLWIGGCRPTMSIRLVYTQSGSELEAHLQDFLSGGAQILGSGGMIELSAPQLNLVNDLQRRTVREEDALSSRAATLQEDLADKPLLTMVMERSAGKEKGEVNGDGKGNGEVRVAMEEYVQKLAALLAAADELRIRTVRELVKEILTPRPAVELLASGKQLHLAIHAWGTTRDRERGQGGD